VKRDLKGVLKYRGKNWNTPSPPPARGDRHYHGNVTDPDGHDQYII